MILALASVHRRRLVPLRAGMRGIKTLLQILLGEGGGVGSFMKG
jgi:hypothetical protein